MRDLRFKIEAAAFVPFAVAPTLTLKLRITSADEGALIQSTAICSQMRFEATHPHFRTEAQGSRNSLRTHAWVEVPSFRNSTLVDLPIPCTSGFAEFATKYFDGCGTAELPPPLMFSGTALYADSEDVIRIAPILWKQETLPAGMWRDMIDSYPSTTASTETLHSVPAVVKETGTYKPRVRGKHSNLKTQVSTPVVFRAWHRRP
jgi:Family of unknown function (DUF6084)